MRASGAPPGWCALPSARKASSSRSCIGGVSPPISSKYTVPPADNPNICGNAVISASICTCVQSIV